jgi:hypothetical protein
MPVYDRFEPVLSRTIPNAWALSAHDTAAIQLLRSHGIRVERITPDIAAMPARISTFMIDSLRTDSESFQGHHQMHVSGRWTDATMQLPSDMMMVRGDQAQAVAALYLLDPESDDGLATWNVFDRELVVGKPFPVWRMIRSSNASP